MRTAITLAAAALAAAVSASATPAQKVAFTKPHWDSPADRVQTTPVAPASTQPYVVQLIPAPETQAPAEENHLHREPDSEEWHCLVPLKQAQASPPTVETIAPNHCQTPSLEPDQLLHLL
jgi:hypothetical protein